MMEKMEQKIPGEHYEEETVCFGSCTTKCMVITFCILVILDFWNELINLYKIGTNKYFV